MIKFIVWINDKSIHPISLNSCLCFFKNPLYTWKGIILTSVSSYNIKKKILKSASGKQKFYLIVRKSQYQENRNFYTLIHIY